MKKNTIKVIFVLSICYFVTLFFELNCYAYELSTFSTRFHYVTPRYSNSNLSTVDDGFGFGLLYETELFDKNTIMLVDTYRSTVTPNQSSPFAPFVYTSNELTRTKIKILQYDLKPTKGNFGFNVCVLKGLYYKNQTYASSHIVDWTDAGVILDIDTFRANTIGGSIGLLSSWTFDYGTFISFSMIVDLGVGAISGKPEWMDDPSRIEYEPSVSDFDFEFGASAGINFGQEIDNVTWTWGWTLGYQITQEQLSTYDKFELHDFTLQLFYRF